MHAFSVLLMPDALAHMTGLDTAALRLGQPARTLQLQGQRLQELARRLGLALRHSPAS